MSEGELYKKICEMQHLQQFHVWYYDDLKKTFDEARKDIFESIPIEELKGITKDNPKLINKLLKWFGNQ